MVDTVCGVESRIESGCPERGVRMLCICICYEVLRKRFGPSVVVEQHTLFFRGVSFLLDEVADSLSLLSLERVFDMQCSS